MRRLILFLYPVTIAWQFRAARVSKRKFSAHKSARLGFIPIVMTIHIFSFVFYTNLVLAAQANSWQCTASDAESKQWVISSPYQRQATNEAYTACKRESRIPNTCAVAHEACEAFVNGVSTKPLWKCTALDRFAKPWVSITYSHRDDAAIAAKAYCEEKREAPDSCYINLLTCKNVHE